MTLGKGANPPPKSQGKPRAKKSEVKIAGKPKMMSMMGKEPFEMKAKKPEPDDRPRPARPKSVNKNQKSQHSARTKRLTGLML